MVESVSSVNSAKKSKAAEEVKAVKETDKVEKQEETKAKKTTQTKEKKKTDETTVKSSYAYDRITIQSKVKEYIENLKKTHDYPMVQYELTKYLDLFKVDDFMKKYPNIMTEADFRTIMYNETRKYL